MQKYDPGGKKGQDNYPAIVANAAIKCSAWRRRPVGRNGRHAAQERKRILRKLDRVRLGFSKPSIPLRPAPTNGWRRLIAAKSASGQRSCPRDFLTPSFDDAFSPSAAALSRYSKPSIAPWLWSPQEREPLVEITETVVRTTLNAMNSTSSSGDSSRPYRLARSVPIRGEGGQSCAKMQVQSSSIMGVCVAGFPNLLSSPSRLPFATCRAIEQTRSGLALRRKIKREGGIFSSRVKRRAGMDGRAREHPWSDADGPGDRSIPG